jgi:hypothetical protein
MPLPIKKMVVAVLLEVVAYSAADAQTRKFYIANDDHTDYMWAAYAADALRPGRARPSRACPRSKVRNARRGGDTASRRMIFAAIGRPAKRRAEPRISMPT